MLVGQHLKTIEGQRRASQFRLELDGAPKSVFFPASQRRHFQKSNRCVHFSDLSIREGGWEGCSLLPSLAPNL